MPPKKKRNIDGANKDDPDQKIKEFEKMYPIPFVLRNELRTLVCLVCWNIVCQRKSLQYKDQVKLMEKLYMGNEKDKEQISYLHLFMTAQDPFDELFEVSPKNTGEMVLKQIYSRRDQDFILGKHITKLKMERVHIKYPGAVVEGRYLYNQARDAVKNIRKALPLTWKFYDRLTGAKNKKYSGYEVEDIVRKVLDDWYSFTSTVEVESDDENKNKKTNNDDDDEEEAGIPTIVATSAEKDDCDVEKESSEPNKDGSDLEGEGEEEQEEEEECDRPEDYSFHGFMGLLRFGPFFSDSKTLEVMLEKTPDAAGDKKQKSNYGRTASRKEEAMDTAFDRERDSNRGMSIADRTRIAQLEMQQCALQMQAKKQRSSDNEAGMLALSMQLSSYRDMFKTLMQLDETEQASRRRWQTLSRKATARGTRARIVKLTNNNRGFHAIGGSMHPGAPGARRAPGVPQGPRRGPWGDPRAPSGLLGWLCIAQTTEKSKPSASRYGKPKPFDASTIQRH